MEQKIKNFDAYDLSRRYQQIVAKWDIHKDEFYPGLASLLTKLRERLQTDEGTTGAPYAVEIEKYIHDFFGISIKDLSSLLDSLGIMKAIHPFLIELEKAGKRGFYAPAEGKSPTEEQYREEKRAYADKMRYDLYK